MDADGSDERWSNENPSTPPLRPGPWVPPSSTYGGQGYAPPSTPPSGSPSPSEPPSAPPLAGAGGQPPAPPVGPPTGLPPEQPGQPGGRHAVKRSSSYAGRILAAALVVLLVAGGAFALGRQNDGGNNPPQNAAANQPVAQTTTTQPPPLSGNEAEPAEAVAKVLGPAVVQIETTQGLGSGFIYDKSGLIMTASHVTDGESTVKVRLADGTSLTGTVVGSDDVTDVAVVRVKANKDLPVATLATGVNITVGQTAIAIGSPFGLQSTVTQGIVSAIGRATETPGGSIPAIQTDAAINPGNSGGALADRQGRIIGINDSIATGNNNGSSSGNVGVGFAIPIDIAKNTADQLVAGKTPRAGFLGVSLSESTASNAGALVTDVTSGSPAADAGLEAGDLITKVDGTNIESPTDLTAAIMSKAPGEKVTVTATRNGQTKQFEVTLAERPGN